MRARPTEYRNEVFRSKTEAIFARCLDLAGVPWCYEPRIPEHPWDFEVRTHCPRCGWHTIYVELKPTMPTETYIKELIEKVRPKVDHCQAFHPRPDQFESYVVWGGPWSEGNRYQVHPIFSRLWEYGWGNYEWDFDHGWHYEMELVLGVTPEIVSEAASFRFDLKVNP